jgi:uncharacterized protein YbjT (DUF2867 family)
MTRSDLPTDQTARTNNAENFAAGCRDGERAAIARAEAAEQRVAALERQVRAMSATPLPVDYAAGPSTFVPTWDPLDPVPAAATRASVAALPSAPEEYTVDRMVTQFPQFGATWGHALANTVPFQVVCSQPKTRLSNAGLSRFACASGSCV